jgi:hypothetical protein
MAHPRLQLDRDVAPVTGGVPDETLFRRAPHDGIDRISRAEAPGASTGAERCRRRRHPVR